MTKQEKRKQKARERTKKWYQSNKEKQSEYYRQYNKKNKEQRTEANRKYYTENKEKCLELVRQYKNKKLNHTVYLFELPDSRMYVGSTNFLNKRLSIHKQDFIRYPDRTLYQAIRETGGWDQVKVHTLMHDIPDEDLRFKLEQYFINKIPKELLLNSNNAVDSIR